MNLVADVPGPVILAILEARRMLLAMHIGLTDMISRLDVNVSHALSQDLSSFVRWLHQEATGQVF